MDKADLGAWSVVRVRYSTHVRYAARDGFGEWPISRNDFFAWIHAAVKAEYQELLTQASWRRVIKIYCGSPKVLEYPYAQALFRGAPPPGHPFPTAFDASEAPPPLPPPCGRLVFAEALLEQDQASLRGSIASSSTASYAISAYAATYDTADVGAQMRRWLLARGRRWRRWDPLIDEKSPSAAVC